ncbi:MAG: YccF domain-containing protein, partial [Desulfosalsimonadaceae bacterium]
LCLKKPNKMIERSESSLNNPENNCHSQNNQKNQLHFFLEINTMAGISYCLTIIGIPFGIAHFKLAIVSFAPLGKRPVKL